MLKGQDNLNLSLNMQVSMPMVYPVHVWDCCCSTLGQRESFPFQNFSLLISVAQIYDGLDLANLKQHKSSYKPPFSTFFKHWWSCFRFLLCRTWDCSAVSGISLYFEIHCINAYFSPSLDLLSPPSEQNSTSQGHHHICFLCMNSIKKVSMLSWIPWAVSCSLFSSSAGIWSIVSNTWNSSNSKMVKSKLKYKNIK